MYSVLSLAVGAVRANKIAEFIAVANHSPSSVSYLLQRGGSGDASENSANLRFIAVEIGVRVPGEGPVTDWGHVDTC